MLVQRTLKRKAEFRLPDFFDFQLPDFHVIQITTGMRELDFVRAQLCVRNRLCGYGYIDVFEDVTRSDAENPLIGFDEVVSLASAMLAAEMIGEAKSGSKLLGFDEETSTVCIPFLRFHDALTCGVWLLWDQRIAAIHLRGTWIAAQCF